MYIAHLWTHIYTPPTYYIPTRCSSETRRTNAVHCGSIADTGATTTVHSHTWINLHCTVLSSITRSTVAHVLLLTHCCTRSTVLAGLEHHTGSDWCVTVHSVIRGAGTGIRKDPNTFSIVHAGVRDTSIFLGENTKESDYIYRIIDVPYCAYLHSTMHIPNIYTNKNGKKKISIPHMYRNTLLCTPLLINLLNETFFTVTSHRDIASSNGGESPESERATTTTLTSKSKTAGRTSEGTLSYMMYSSTVKLGKESAGLGFRTP